MISSFKNCQKWLLWLTLILVFDHQCDNNEAVEVEIVNGFLSVRSDPSGELLFGDRILKIAQHKGIAVKNEKKREWFVFHSNSKIFFCVFHKILVFLKKVKENFHYEFYLIPNITRFNMEISLSLQNRDSFVDEVWMFLENY